MNISKGFFIKNITVICVVFLVTTCKGQSLETFLEVGDGGLLSGEPCGPPCFWDITPGHTTRSQTIEILQDKGMFQSCDLFDNSKESGGRGIVCGPILIVNLRDKADIVTSLGFKLSQEITVEDVGWFINSKKFVDTFLHLEK